MKRLMPILLLSSLGLFVLSAAASASEDQVTPEECIARCKAAAEMIRTSGMEAALKAMNDKSGPFVWKNSYVTCIHLETGKILAQPFAPNTVGYQVKFAADKSGKLFIQEMMNLVEKQGEGWVDYVWSKPGSEEPAPKTTYVLKVPGEKVMVMSGYYPQP